MNRHLVLILLSTFASTLVYGDILADKHVQLAQTGVSSETATGETQTTVVDEGGSLKMVPVDPTPSQKRKTPLGSSGAQDQPAGDLTNQNNESMPRSPLEQLRAPGQGAEASGANQREQGGEIPQVERQQQNEPTSPYNTQTRPPGE